MVNPLTEELRIQELKYRMPTVTHNEPDSMALIQEKLFSYNAAAVQRMKIPRIIHHIYEDPAGPPGNLFQISKSWQERMPQWEYRFWNKQMIADFLKSICPDFSDIYHSYPFNVQRWDAIRYLILYHIGGLYVDMDYECIRPLDVLLADSTCCMGMEPTINSRIYNKALVVGNALMASKPKHPYIAKIIEELKKNYCVNYGESESAQVLESTGPFMTTRVYEKFKRKKDITLLPADLVAPLTAREMLALRIGYKHSDILKKIKNAYAIHHFWGTWFEQVDKK